MNLPVFQNDIAFKEQAFELKKHIFGFLLKFLALNFRLVDLKLTLVGFNQKLIAFCLTNFNLTFTKLL